MSNPEIIQIEKRQDRMEDAIERLTQISYDLNRMLAVQEQRITQQEKNFLTIEKNTEDFFDKNDAKFEEVDKKIAEKTKVVSDDLKDHKEEHNKQITEIKDEIHNIEKIIWTYLGGFTVIVFLITYGDKILQALEKIV